MKPTMISLEGLDGAGKSTQLELLGERIRAVRPVRKIKFPDYDDPSSALVRMYLSGEFGGSPEDTSAYAASTFYAVDRYASYRRHWQEDYENGTVIISDRYTQSNVIYQMPKLPRSEWRQYIDWLYDLEYDRMGIPRPDQVILLDLDPDLAGERVLSRYHGDTSKRDIHERDLNYLRTCREAALTAADYLGWKVIACADAEGVRSRGEVSEELFRSIAPIL